MLAKGFGRASKPPIGAPLGTFHYQDTLRGTVISDFQSKMVLGVTRPVNPRFKSVFVLHWLR